MKLGKKEWTFAGLGLMAIWLVWELIGAFDKNPETLPLTQIIVGNVPQWIGLPIIAFFSSWLIIHFIKYYNKEK